MKSGSDLASEFDIEETYVELVESADYNVAPTKRVPTVLTSTPRGEDEQARQLRVLQWGLVPFWAKDPKIGNKILCALSSGSGHAGDHRQFGFCTASDRDVSSSLYVGEGSRGGHVALGQCRASGAAVAAAGGSPIQAVRPLARNSPAQTIMAVPNPCSSACGFWAVCCGSPASSGSAATIARPATRATPLFTALAIPAR